jgi:DNA-binding transcriptional MocR family regulator
MRDALVTALRAHLPHLRLHGIAAGLHLMIELDQHLDERAILVAAEHRSIRVYGARVPREAAQRTACARGGLWWSSRIEHS